MFFWNKTTKNTSLESKSVNEEPPKEYLLKTLDAHQKITLSAEHIQRKALIVHTYLQKLLKAHGEWNGAPEDKKTNTHTRFTTILKYLTLSGNELKEDFQHIQTYYAHLLVTLEEASKIQEHPEITNAITFYRTQDAYFKEMTLLLSNIITSNTQTLTQDIQSLSTQLLEHVLEKNKLKTILQEDPFAELKQKI